MTKGIQIVVRNPMNEDGGMESRLRREEYAHQEKPKLQIQPEISKPQRKQREGTYHDSSVY